ncbi:MAG: ComF family protein [Schleiferiaceae bacterium]
MARHLGYHFLGPAIASAHKDIVLVPMPVSKRRRRRRGYNQSEGLAQGCLRKLSESGYRATVALLLEKHAHRKSQIEVDPFERWTNPRGSLRVRQKIKQRIPQDALLVLIDDTVTTGSTLLYAAEVVREAFPEQPLHMLALALEV